MAQITRVTSEALQATIRRLLPSQVGFGEDLEATNVIQPIIDLTPTAEGSALPEYLQRAYNFTDAIIFDSFASTIDVTSTPGFYQITTTLRQSNLNATTEGQIRVNNGLTTKQIWGMTSQATGSSSPAALTWTGVVILSQGETLQVHTSTNESRMVGQARQIADINGNLIDPSGYVSQ
jgi:hypothetical protein